jgi:hypothetical protein
MTEKKIDKFVIDHKNWLRGEGTQDSYLLRKDGKMCCLGFMSKAFGVPENEILEVTMPFVLDNDRDHDSWLLYPECVRHDIDMRDISEVNDDENTDDAFKEKAIKEYMKTKYDLDVEFVG